MAMKAASSQLFSKSLNRIRPLYYIQKRNTLWESDPKSGYVDLDKWYSIPFKQRCQMAVDSLARGWREMKTEIKDHFTKEPRLVFNHGDFEYVWNFKRAFTSGQGKELMEKFILTSDKDNNEGLSWCKAATSPGNSLLFYGKLDPQLPKDGGNYYAGYATLKSMRKRASFGRPSEFEWYPYSHIVLKFRGDGRTYHLNLGTPGTADITWNDLYSYPLYTRGGPYWQIAKIPFSKFVFSSKGRIQDKQDNFIKERCSSIGISLMDRVSGHFQLEIEYVAVLYDQTHKEECAYEKYKQPAQIINW